MKYIYVYIYNDVSGGLPGSSRVFQAVTCISFCTGGTSYFIIFHRAPTEYRMYIERGASSNGCHSVRRDSG